jgi:hypothetical protein
VQRETSAKIDKLRNGLATLSETDPNWRATIDQMAIEKEYAESKGVKLDYLPQEPKTEQA